MANTVTFTIEGPEGDHDELQLPAGFTDIFAEEGETPAEVLGDIAMLSAAQQIHAVVHHGHGEADSEVEAMERTVMDRFEARFGQTYGEMTGHSH